MDVGDIVVDSEPSETGSVAGRVVDAAGEPLAGVPVHARATRGGMELGSATTDREGRFVLDGIPVGEPVTVWAERHGFLGAEIAGVAVGTADLQFALAPAGRVVGSVRTDEGIALDRIEVTLAGRSLALARAQAPGPGGVFVFEPLPAGEATLAVRIHGTSWRLATGMAATVVAGRTTSLDPIDLRGRLRNLEARVRTGDGEPLQSPRVRITDDAGDGAKDLRTDAEGVLRAVVPAEPARLWIEADGFARASFANAAEVTIVLQRP
jgi:hypothetical protein